MIDRTPWLQRQFETGLPAGLFPNVLERLRGTPARVEERLRGVPDARLSVRAGDAWSILENVGHLVQTEELWAARLDDFEARRPELTPARFEQGRVEGGQFNRQRLSDVCAAFRAARAALVTRLEALGDDDLQAVARHPRLDRPMRPVDLMVFIAEHDDHHLATITRLMGRSD